MDVEFGDTEPMIYNYRFDRNHLEEITERLTASRELSQGWGGGRAADLNITSGDFVTRCKSYYGLATTRVPTNLARIRDLKKGDLLVVPHLPKYGLVSVHVVADDFPACYAYNPNDDTHQNHRLRISRSYGLEGGISVRHVALAPWYGKLQWFRLPLLPIPQHEAAFRSIVEELDRSPQQTFSASGLDEFIDKLREEVIGRLKHQLSQVRPSGSDVSFEAVCERLVVAAGYRIVGRNQYDGEGGDVDLRCVRERSDLSPFETGQATLLVQVKKHDGETDDRAV